jgi:CRP/FNR family cyclic AMP-dependent transcriptional regulator
VATGRERGGYESPSLHTLMRRSWERPTERDWADVIAALPLFSRLGKRQVRGLAKLATIVDYSPGEIVVQAGERGDSFYLVLEGGASVAGKSRTLGPGDFFGEMALIDGGPRSATVTAKTEMRTMKLPRRAFIKTVEQDSRIALAIMEVLAERVRRLERAPSS